MSYPEVRAVRVMPSSTTLPATRGRSHSRTWRHASIPNFRTRRLGPTARGVRRPLLVLEKEVTELPAGRKVAQTGISMRGASTQPSACNPLKASQLVDLIYHGCSPPKRREARVANQVEDGQKTVSFSQEHVAIWLRAFRI